MAVFTCQTTYLTPRDQGGLCPPIFYRLGPNTPHPTSHNKRTCKCRETLDLPIIHYSSPKHDGASWGRATTGWKLEVTLRRGPGERAAIWVMSMAGGEGSRGQGRGRVLLNATAIQ